MTIRMDFHLHTVSSKGKDDGFEFSMPWLKNYTKKLGLTAIAITNHNLFDRVQFEQIEQELDCIVLPGVELSLESGHVNLVFDNNQTNLSNLTEACSELQLGSTDGLTLENFKNIFSKLRKGLFIAEYGKSRSLILTDELKDPFFSDYTIVRGVNSQLKFHRALLQLNAPCPVLFSDAHATESDPDPLRNDMAELGLKNTFLQIERFSFSQVLRELKQSTHVRVNEDGKPNTFQIDVEGMTVTVSTGLNLLVGLRGSGKTFFLDHINRQYNNADTSVAYIRQFKNTEDTEQFLKNESNRIVAEARGEWVRKHKPLLDGIVHFYKDDSKDQSDVYLKSLKRFANELASSNIAKQVKLFAEDKYEITDMKSSQASLVKFSEVLSNKALWQYSTPSKRVSQFNNVKSAYMDIRSNVLTREINNEIKARVNGIIDDVKIVVKKTTAIDPVENVDLFNQFARRKEEERIVEAMQAALSEQQDVSRDEYSYKIHVWKANWESAEDFKKNVSVGGRVKVKDALIKPYLKKDYKTFLTNLFSEQYQTHLTLENGTDLSRLLFNFKVELLTSAGTTASGGQQLALGLMMKLDDAKRDDIVLVDEPEGSLDNVFIKDKLIPKLHELAENTPVIVITHNSTLGTLLNPDRLMIAKFDLENRKHQLLTGDFLAGKVADASGHETQSYEDFVEAMEAGIKTYQEKGEKYENLREN